MNDAPIAFFDSGVGGLPYLEWIRERLPNETLIYIADTAHFPYGEKPVEDVRAIVMSVVDRLTTVFNPKLIVIACNTASVIALSSLRQTFTTPFVGVVPAIKPAAEHSRKGSIGLLATSQTVAHAYTDGLINDFAFNCTVLKFPIKDLVHYVEHQWLTDDSRQRNAFVKKALRHVNPAKVDTIILGCTHFIHLEQEIGNFFGKDITLIDSRMGVGNQILKILDEKKLLTRGKTKEDTFWTTGGTEREIYRDFAKKFGLSYHGSFFS